MKSLTFFKSVSTNFAAHCSCAHGLAHSEFSIAQCLVPVYISKDIFSDKQLNSTIMKKACFPLPCNPTHYFLLIF